METTKQKKTAADLRKFTWRDLVVILCYLPLQFLIGIIVSIVLVALAAVSSLEGTMTLLGSAEFIGKVSIYGMFIAGLLSSIFILLAYRPLLVDDWHRFMGSLGKNFGLIVAGYLFIFLVQIGINYLLPIPESENQAVLESMFAGGSKLDMILMLISVTFFAPIGEELLCRKAIFGSFFEKKVVAIIMFVVSSTLFGMLHYGFDGQILSLIPYVLMGAIMGGLYWYSNNLMLPIGLHFLNNLIASIVIIISILG